MIDQQTDMRRVLPREEPKMSISGFGASARNAGMSTADVSALNLFHAWEARRATTVSKHSNRMPSTGYFVAVNTIDTPSAPSLSLCAFVVKGCHPAPFVGLWIDGFGDAVLENTEHVDTLEGAYRLGRQYRQYSIWDIANECELVIPYAGIRIN